MQWPRWRAGQRPSLRVSSQHAKRLISIPFKRVACQIFLTLLICPPTADFTVRDTPPQFVIHSSTSLPVVTLKERKDAGTHSGSPSGSVPNSDRSSIFQAVLLCKEKVLLREGCWWFSHVRLFGNSQLSESSETESDASKVNGRSEELLPTPGSSTSTESSFGDGIQFSDCVEEKVF